jgi:putative transposase
VSVVAKRHAVSEQTIYVSRKRFRSIEASDLRRLKALEAENARLKKLVAERDLEIEVMEIASFGSTGTAPRGSRTAGRKGTRRACWRAHPGLIELTIISTWHRRTSPSKARTTDPSCSGTVKGWLDVR